SAGSPTGNTRVYDGVVPNLNITGPLHGGNVTIIAVPADLALTTANSCYSPGATVTVSIDLSDGPAAIVGAAFYLAYDKSRLTFVSAVPGPLVWTAEISESVNTSAGTIDYTVGIPNGGIGAASGTMAILTFTAAAEVCNTAGLVSFRANSPS